MDNKFRVAIAIATVSAAGFVGIVNREGYTEVASAPVKGDVPTNGFGSTGPDVHLGDKTTPVKAVNRAMRDIGKASAGVQGCVTVAVSQGEFDAYTSLAYNIGVEAFCYSTLVRKLNAGDYDGACREILRWDKFRGKPLLGLTIRRGAEYQQCKGNPT